MFRFTTCALIASLTLVPMLAEAQGNGRGNGNGRGDNPLHCPPGLAKKDPACVPPGLARQGVTTQDHLGIDDDDWEEITAENPELADDDDTPVTNDEDVPTGPLTSAEIAEVFDLDPPPPGQTYGVVDGQVVALDPEEALILEQVKIVSTPVQPGNGAGVVPDVTLDQQQLVAIYDLPEPAPDTSYAVIDGAIYAVPTETYGLLQLIQTATAV